MSPPDLVNGFEWTDSGNAERLVAAHAADLRFVRSWGKWIAWEGRRWVDDQGAVYRAAKATARAVHHSADAIDDDDQRAKVIRFSLRMESRSSIESMVALARHDARVAIVHTQLDADRMLLNCANGTVDLRTGELRAHGRDDLLTKLARAEYREDAPCPTWDAFVLRVMGGDAEMVSYLQRLSGYALTGEIREHILAFFFGKGANGKSTFLRTLHAVLGDYASPAPRGLLFRSRGERHPTELASLHGRRFVTCSEVEEGQAFDEALVKDLTGGDPIECRRMREDFWSFEPTHKLFLAGNHKPAVRGDDDGIWRRMRLVPWLVTFAANEQDKRLAEKLLDEAPGILAWCVRGCIDWQARGLTEPEAVRKATADYREESDPVGEFFRLQVVFDPQGRIARKDLRETYETFCKENGAQPLGAKRFAARLREHSVSEANVRRGAQFVNGWRGVRLMTEAERAAAEVWTGRRGSEGTCGSQDPDCSRDDVSSSLTGIRDPQVPTYPLATEPTFGDWLDGQGIGGEE